MDANPERDVLALVLAGGRGTRLGGLTQRTAKPAVPFGGQNRIIDFALSNCLNSGIRRIAVLTQYQAHSLIVHLQQAWGFLRRGLDEFLETWPAQQGARERWYGGTADAVYQNLAAIRRHRPRLVLILPGDHVSQLDYRPLIAAHLAGDDDVTVACAAVPLAEACHYGIVELEPDGRIAHFVEKPARPLPQANGMALASMGIYVFDAACLEGALCRAADVPDHDFGRHLIPRLVRAGRARAHVVGAGRHAPFYWRDVGTLAAYYESNMALLDPQPRLDLDPPDWPLRAEVRPGPPARFRCDGNDWGVAVNSLVASGCVVSGGRVRHSVLSRDVRVERGARVEDSVVLPGAVIGAGAFVRNVIVDCGCRVPPGARTDGRAADDGRVALVTQGSFDARPAVSARRPPLAAPRRQGTGDQLGIG